jgi:hypothetical protein
MPAGVIASVQALRDFGLLPWARPGGVRACPLPGRFRVADQARSWRRGDVGSAPWPRGSCTCCGWRLTGFWRRKLRRRRPGSVEAASVTCPRCLDPRPAISVQGPAMKLPEPAPGTPAGGFLRGSRRGGDGQRHEGHAGVHGQQCQGPESEPPKRGSAGTSVPFGLTTAQDLRRSPSGCDWQGGFRSGFLHRHLFWRGLPQCSGHGAPEYADKGAADQSGENEHRHGALLRRLLLCAPTDGYCSGWKVPRCEALHRYIKTHLPRAAGSIWRPRSLPG